MRRLLLLAGVLLALAAAGCGGADEQSPDLRRAGEALHLPDLPHDARALERPDRRPHARVHPRADRCRRLAERDRRGARRRLRRGRARRAARSRASTCSPGCSRSSRAGSRSSPWRSRFAAGAGAARGRAGRARVGERPAARSTPSSSAGSTKSSPASRARCSTAAQPLMEGEDPARVRGRARLLRDPVRAAARPRLPRRWSPARTWRRRQARRSRAACRSWPASPRCSSLLGAAAAAAGSLLRREPGAVPRGRGASRRRPRLRHDGAAAAALPRPPGRAGPVEGARSTGSAALLGGAFGLCAAPCIGPVLAGDSRAGRRRPDGRRGHAPAPRLLGRARAPVPGSSASASTAPWARSAGSATTTGVFRVVARRAARRPRPAALLRPLLVAAGGGEPAPSSSSGSASEASRARDGGGRSGKRLTRVPRRRREQRCDVEAAVRRRVRRESARRLLELALAADSFPRPAWYQATATWTRPW